MRLLIILALAVSLAAAFTVGASERGGDDGGEVKAVTITLTTKQGKDIKDAKTGNVTITLTKSQITAISKEFPNFKGKTVTLEPTTHVLEGNKIVVSVDRVGEANPQPSP